MKLKEVEKNTKQKIQKFLLPLAGLYFAYMVIDATTRIGFSLYYLTSTGLMILTCMIAIYLILDRFNQDYKYLKQKGKKHSGKIIGYGNNSNYEQENHYIIIQYNNKKKKIRFLERNNAFIILEVLIEHYSIDGIPIDIYTKGRKVYADLESLDLSQMENYEKALKFAENSLI